MKPFLRFLLTLLGALIFTSGTVYTFIRVAHSVGVWEAHYDNPSSIDQHEYEPGTHECHE